MGMAYEQAFGIAGGVGRGFLDFDDGVLASGDDEAVRVLGVWGEEGEAAEPFVALSDDAGIEGGWVLGGPAPES